MENKIIRGAIIIPYANTDERIFLVVTNTKTNNISFISGAEEEEDTGSLERTAQREMEEELGIPKGTLQLTATGINHEFVFNAKKADRAGKKAEYQIFLADATEIKNQIQHTEELRDIRWMTEEEVLDSLTFPELKVLFKEALLRNPELSLDRSEQIR
jgi:isopentenyldiphosphate isomerase